MSQPPLSYAAPNPYPPPSNRPTAVTVLAIIGIVFGGLGLLCLGFAELFSIIAVANPAMARGLQAQPSGQRVMNLVLGFVGLLLSIMLLAASIGSLNLKPLARRVMIQWAVIDISWDFVRLLIFFLIVLPHLPENPAFAQNPNTQQIAGAAKIGGAISAVIMWLIATVFATLVIIFFRKPETVAAFERPKNSDPYSAVPPPPM